MEFKEGMTFKEFTSTKKKRSENKLKADFGVKDYFEHYRHSVWRYQGGRTRRGTFRQRMNKNGKWTLSQSEYNKILTSINNLLLEATLQGEDIQLPLDFGILYARQKPIYTKVDDKGNLKTNRAVNWQETLKLWYADRESRDCKQVVYQDNCKVKAYINIKFGDFPNKNFFSLVPNTTMMRNLAKQLKEGKLMLPPVGSSMRAIKDL